MSGACSPQVKLECPSSTRLGEHKVMPHMPHAGAQQDAINHWAARVRQLEKDIVQAREEVLAGEATSSYFVFFSSQKDAAIAAQTNLHPEDGHSFRVYEAPGPEEVASPFSLRCACCDSRLVQRARSMFIHMHFIAV